MAEGTRCVNLLGPVVVEVDGRRVTNFRSHKTLALLAYLVSERRPISRNHLAALLWPDVPRAEGRGHLRRALHDLALKVPAAILGDVDTLEFNPAFYSQSDIARFTALAGTGIAADLEAAQLSRGRFLEGLVLEGCPEFEVWVTTEREAWRKRKADVFSRVIDHHVRGGRFELALPYAWQLCALEPWREEHHLRLVTLLARSGDPATALKVYRRAVRTLAEELDGEPSPAFAALAEQIRASRDRNHTNIPTALTPFVGREAELAALGGRLLDPSCRLITLTGPGGVGKSRLAVQAGLEADGPGRLLFLDGVYLVRLESCHTLEQFLATMSQAVGISTRRRAVTLDLLLLHLSQREMLLILDDFDLLVDHKGVLLTILDAAPRVKLLVTAQDRLDLFGEWLLPVKGLTAAEPAGGTPAEALDLFLLCLRRYGIEGLDAGEVDAAVHLCELVGGFPLAIELAASCARSQGIADIVAAVETNLDLLITTEQRAPRHISMRAALACTWGRLRPDEQSALCCLSVFEGCFSDDVAAQVTGVPAAMLLTLTDKALITRTLAVSDAAGGQPTYALHKLVRQFARAQLESDARQFAEVRAAHAAYFLRLLQERVVAAGDKREPGTTLQDITAVLSDVLKAWEYEQRSGHATGADEALIRYYHLLGLPPPAVVGSGAHVTGVEPAPPRKAPTTRFPFE